VRPTVSAILPDGSLLETLYRPNEHKTVFCIVRDGEWRYEKDLVLGGEQLVPYSPRNNLLAHENRREVT